MSHDESLGMGPSHSRTIALECILYCGLKKYNCILANSYNFWPSGKRLILTISIRVNVVGSIPNETIAEEEIVSQNVASIVPWA